MELKEIKVAQFVFAAVNFLCNEMEKIVDGAERRQTSGAPRQLKLPRQAHSSHLCFVGPHCAIKNKERDEMEEQIQLISSIFIHSPALRCPIQSKDF